MQRPSARASSRKWGCRWSRDGSSTSATTAITPAPKDWPYRVAIVNQTFVKRYFKGGNALGRHIGIGDDPGTAMPIEIIGVAKDMRYTAIREDDRPQVFFPYLQASGVSGLVAYVRTAGRPTR